VFPFNLYDLFVMSFVQLILSTALVLSPARNLDTKLRWTGSRVTEVLVGTLAATAVAAAACLVTVEVWGLGARAVETAGLLLVLASVVVMALRPDCRVVGQIFYASYASAGIAFLAFAIRVAAGSTHSVLEGLTASLWLLLGFSAFLVWTSNVNYVSDVLCRARRSRPLPEVDPNYKPMVSLHLAAYNEPPELFIETIKAVERIDYPNFEAVVIDNNTMDPAVWKPIEEYCRDRPRLKFVHVAPWPGFKAGACNLALRQHTDPKAEIIGIVDADDIVQPHYLKETAPYFCDPKVGFVQSFEGNREYHGSSYYQACVDSYQGFYVAIMSSRNERDSVPFVGTMGLFRRSALEEAGGWNEWCISEDTEASLRVLKAGWSGLYIPRCFGRGIVPPSYAGLNTQRYRWCFGAMQIFRLHWRSLMPWDRSPDNHLSSSQRRDYLMACLGWWRDLIMVGFSLLLLVVTGLLLSGSSFVLTPLGGDRSLLPMSLIIVAVTCMTVTLVHWTGMSFRRCLLSLVVSLSACWVTGVACVTGLTQREGVFRRTSKSLSPKHRIRKALRLTRSEAVLGGALYIAGAILLTRPHVLVVLTVITFLQGSVYMCSPVVALWNVFAQQVPATEYRRRYERRQLRAMARRRRPRLARLVTTVLASAAVGLGVAAFTAPANLLTGVVSQARPAHAATQIQVPAASSARAGTGRTTRRPALSLLKTSPHASSRLR
jgi:cellulose synthase/poly-beta-1,6-N-acetylglucosamine synthase-like glycosyltransferase